ncbi:hypothetical protein [Rubritalea tangerina]
MYLRTRLIPTSSPSQPPYKNKKAKPIGFAYFHSRKYTRRESNP